MRKLLSLLVACAFVLRPSDASETPDTIGEAQIGLFIIKRGKP